MNLLYLQYAVEIEKTGSTISASRLARFLKLGEVQVRKNLLS